MKSQVSPIAVFIARAAQQAAECEVYRQALRDIKELAPHAGFGGGLHRIGAIAEAALDYRPATRE